MSLRKRNQSFFARLVSMGLNLKLLDFLYIALQIDFVMLECDAYNVNEVLFFHNDLFHSLLPIHTYLETII